MPHATPPTGTPAPDEASPGQDQGLAALLRRAFGVERGEQRIVLWSAVYFFFVLTSNFILRPVRDALGSGMDQAQLFLGTLLSMLAATPLYGWLVARLPRRWFVPIVYRFFLANLLVFYLCFRALGFGTAPRLTFAFFVWHAVFNLFAVSVFWSLMVDVFGPRQGRRLFVVIGMVGTLGAWFGSRLSGELARRLPQTADLLVLAMIALELAAFCASRVMARQRLLAQRPRGTADPEPGATEAATDRPLGGGILQGIKQVFATRFMAGISVYMILSTMTATFVYNSRSAVVAAAIKDMAERTELLARVESWTQGLTLLTQCFLTRHILRWLGVGLTLCLVPLVSFLGLGALGFAPVLAIVVVVDVTRRAAAFSLEVPARSLLFTVATRAEKYKAKGFIDTVLYRGGDYVGAELFKWLGRATGGFANACLWTAPIAAVWGVLGFTLGREQRRRETQRGS